MGRKIVEDVDMSGPNDERPSLDRLKALDSSPDLPSQLAEAKRLCNHAHRAEMVIKWLVAKLQSSAEVKANADIWGLFRQCLRLLQPTRIVSLLGRYDLLSGVTNALDQCDGSQLRQLLLAIHGVLTLLFEISQSPESVAVKRVLRTDGSKATNFIGGWMRNLLRLSHESSNPKHADLVHEESFQLPDVLSLVVLDVPIQVWSLRKLTTDEANDFCDSCFVPAAEMLARLSKNVPANAAGKRKRNSGEVVDRTTEYRRFLEGLFAREVFLPARTAFIESQDPSRLRAILQPFKKAVSNAADPTHRHSTAVPYLLDIALRCVPTPTPRQRQKEKPWVEAVFDALLDCMKSDYPKTDLDHDVLMDMLEVIRKRASLSMATLKDILLSPSVCLVEEPGQQPPDWEIVAKIAEVDANVFLDDSVAPLFFERLSESSINCFDDRVDRSKSELKQLCQQDKLMKPVGTAYAKSRQLPAFLDQWFNQVEMHPNNAWAQWSVWTSLDEPLAELFETYMTVEQIEELIDHVYESVQDLPRVFKEYWSEENLPELEKRPEFCRLQASIVVLSAVAYSVRSDELVELLCDKLKSCFEDMMAIFESGHWAERISNHVWSFLSRLFDLWWPSWLAKQKDEGAVAARAEMIVGSIAVETVLRTIDRHAHSLNEGPDWCVGALSRAEHFVAHICSKLAPFGNCRELCQTHVQELMRSSTSSAFLTYPVIIDLIPRNARITLIVNTMDEEAISEDEPDGNPQNNREAVKSLVEIAYNNPHLDLVDQIIEVAIRNIEANDVNSRLGMGGRAVEMLSYFPSGLLSRRQREQMLNCLCALDYSAKGPEDDLYVRDCFSLMIQLMQQPFMTSSLCSNPLALWRLSAVCDDLTERKPKSLDQAKVRNFDSKALALLEEITRLLLKQLLGSLDIARTVDLLTQHSERVQSSIQHLTCIGAGIRDDLGTLSIVKVMVLTMRFIQEPFRLKVVKHGKDLQLFLAVLCSEATKFTEPSHGGWKAADSAVLSCLIDAALAVLSAMKPERGDLPNGADVQLKALAAEVLHARKSSEDAMDTASEPDQNGPLLAKAYSIFCMPALKLSHLEQRSRAMETLDHALGILSQILQPPEHDVVVSAFAGAFARFGPEHQAQMVGRLTSKELKPSGASVLLLKAALAGAKSNDTQNEIQGGNSDFLHILSIVETSVDLSIHAQAVDSIVHILQHKSHYVNQHATEQTLMVVRRLTENQTSAAGIRYTNACQIMSTLLLHQRHRLNGRFHLIIDVLQALMARLFRPIRLIATEAKSRKQLAVRHTRAFTRLLTLLCNPPHHRKAGSNDLVDQARKDRAHVGQYVQYLLHHYCAQILNGTLAEGMREALTPGLWAIIEAIEVNSPDGIKALSAAMNNSERAVLRGMYDDWKRLGKWQGG